jgi:GNAT superfamily N-acetyltransferase
MSPSRCSLVARLLERLLAHSVPAAYALRCMSARNQRLDFRLDDLSGEPTRRLIARHLAGMHDNSPAGCVHALDADALRQSGVTFWSAWVGDEIAGCGALTHIDAARGELKSMRVADGFLGQGVGRCLATATPEPEPNPREVAALDEATYALALRRCAELLHRLQALSLGNPFDRAGRGLKVLASRGARIARRMTGMR